jgi:hypothetical protein
MKAQNHAKHKECHFNYVDAELVKQNAAKEIKLKYKLKY